MLDVRPPKEITILSERLTVEIYIGIFQLWCNSCTERNKMGKVCYGAVIGLYKKSRGVITRRRASFDISLWSVESLVYYSWVFHHDDAYSKIRYYCKHDNFGLSKMFRYHTNSACSIFIHLSEKREAGASDVRTAQDTADGDMRIVWHMAKEDNERCLSQPADRLLALLVLPSPSRQHTN